MVAWSREDGVRNRSAAEWVSYLLEPKNWIIATTLAVGWHSDGAAGLARPETLDREAWAEVNLGTLASLLDPAAGCHWSCSCAVERRRREL